MDAGLEQADDGQLRSECRLAEASFSRLGLLSKLFISTVHLNGVNEGSEERRGYRREHTSSLDLQALLTTI